MSSDVFNSDLTLIFCDKLYETKYGERKFHYLRKYNIIHSMVLTTLSVGFSIFMLVKFSTFNQNTAGRFTAIFSFVTSLMSIVLLLLTILIKNNKLQNWVTHLNYMMILFIFVNYRYLFIVVCRVDVYIFVLIFTLETMFRLTWFFLGCMDFIQGVYLQVLSIVLNFVILSALFPMSKYFRFSIFALLMMSTTCISYFYIKEQKRSFYFNLALALKNEWYESILDNINSGFISIRDRKIHYINKTLLRLFRREDCGVDRVRNPIANNENNSLHTHFNINDLFNNVVCENITINSFEGAAGILKNKYDESSNNFIFLGNKDIEAMSSCNISLEVYGRCYSTNNKSLIDRYEFIFNDVTRPKLIEQNKAEFKYKALFLSKVAHEFKNPLLCICELVDQISEKISTDIQFKDGISDILKQIKSMSNYLIILVKDMDYFSERNSKKIEKRIDLDNVNLTEIINFCSDIVYSLIKKHQKEACIEFEVMKDPNLQNIFITTDEIKLKQVLINLLSNSVKYTQHGKINLKITMEGKRLKFQVDDTGRGMTEQQKANLFIPFSNEFDKHNKVSSGLGLSIVKELVELLGSKIEYTSTPSKGSSFWFYLNIDQRDIISNPIFDVTTEKILFNELPIQDRLTAHHVPSNIIIVDDEINTRKSTVRLLKKFLREKNIRTNVLEASDGIECLYIFYNLISNGKTIYFIISDETMFYLSGSATARILRSIEMGINMSRVPFYILTAYESLNVNLGDVVDEVYSKPLSKQSLVEILKNLNN
jgi:nitrogen-specific signal transduction histidine kinase/CheY-like chemotaxis protein